MLRARFETILKEQWFGSQPQRGVIAAATGSVCSLAQKFTEPAIDKKLAQSLTRKRRTHQIKAPLVIVVGNLIVGGAGKTPVTTALALHLKSLGFSVGLMTGGYKSAASSKPAIATPQSDAKSLGDESVLLRQATGLPLVAGRDRTNSLRLLCATHPELQIVICDDGLQHNELKRDIEVVVFDDRLIGNAKVLPMGPLREPMTSLATADFIITATGTKEPLRKLLIKSGIAQKPISEQQWLLSGFMRLSDYYETHSNPPLAATKLLSSTDFGSLIANNKERTFAIAGMGNPEKFFRVLSHEKIVFQTLALADHQVLPLKWLRAHQSDTIILTEKDAVKCMGFHSQDLLGNAWVAIGSAHLSASFYSDITKTVTTLMHHFSR